MLFLILNKLAYLIESLFYFYKVTSILIHKIILLEINPRKTASYALTTGLSLVQNWIVEKKVVPYCLYFL